MTVVCGLSSLVIRGLTTASSTLTTDVLSSLHVFSFSKTFEDKLNSHK